MSYHVFAKTEPKNSEDDKSSDEYSDDSGYEYPQSDGDDDDDDSESDDELNEKRQYLTEEQNFLLALHESEQEDIQRNQAKEKALQQAKETEEQALQLALNVLRQEEIKRKQIEQDPTRIKTVQDEFVELILRQYVRMEEQQDYDIWATFFRLIVCYDYSMFLAYIIPSIAAFWKSRKYEIDQKYGVLVVQPKIIELVWELRTKLIEFMKESYGPSDHVALTDAEEEKLIKDAVMANYAKERSKKHRERQKKAFNDGTMNRIQLRKYLKEKKKRALHATNASKAAKEAPTNAINMDLGEWPTSKVSKKRHGWPKSLKPYEEKWNLLFEQEQIRDHFKQKVYKESLFLVGALYHFFKYNQEI